MRISTHRLSGVRDTKINDTLALLREEYLAIGDHNRALEFLVATFPNKLTIKYE